VSDARQAWVVVPAAGQGTRMGASLPKQYLELGGRSVLAHTLTRLLGHPRVAGVVLAVAPGDARWRAEVPPGPKSVHAVTGGDTRADSVRAALDALAQHQPPEARVLVHDAVRPCVHADDIERLVAACWDDAVGGLLAVPLADTVKEAGDDRVLRTLPREHLWRAQTPQLFRLGALRDALRLAASARTPVTDEASALEALGHRPRLVAGRPDNIKITQAADLALAAAILGGPA
jgi:2-C-methyl-D-erythritol 4-phosphate cytidylyltransferase